ncbi:hypothetical protein GH733_018574 [Mirounga leonina]|nr:hypothetical protein GH733_018574 [Mirounga leonina]
MDALRGSSKLQKMCDQPKSPCSPPKSPCCPPKSPCCPQKPPCCPQKPPCSPQKPPRSPQKPPCCIQAKCCCLEPKPECTCLSKKSEPTSPQTQNKSSQAQQQPLSPKQGPKLDCVILSKPGLDSLTVKAPPAPDLLDLDPSLGRESSRWAQEVNEEWRSGSGGCEGKEVGLGNNIKGTLAPVQLRTPLEASAAISTVSLRSEVKVRGKD